MIGNRVEELLLLSPRELVARLPVAARRSILARLPGTSSGTSGSKKAADWSRSMSDLNRRRRDARRHAAPDHGVPRRVRPFDEAAVSHLRCP